MQKVDKRPMRFLVDFGQLQLPEAAARELESGIQKVALASLSTLDFQGDLRRGKLPWGWCGMIFDEWPFGGLDLDRFGPSPEPGDSSGPDLTVADHTRTMELVMARPLEIVRILGPRAREIKSLAASEVLGAVCKLEGLPTRQTEALAEMHRISLHMDSPRRLPRTVQAALSEMHKRIDAASGVEDLLERLTAMECGGEFSSIPGAEAALRLARQLVEDGSSSIYDDHYGFYRDFAVASAPGDVAKDDVKGAVSGGILGIVGGWAGIGAGALTGGTAGSVKSVVSKVVDWISDLF